VNINLDIVRDEEDSVLEIPERKIPEAEPNIPLRRKCLWWISGRCHFCGGEFEADFLTNWPHTDFRCVKCGRNS
jgi:hypothetical protein